VAVTIGMPTGHRPRVQLCPWCYRTHYLPLIAELAVEVVHEAPPPAPGAMPRGRHTCR